MGKVKFKGSGGGTVYSSDLTANKNNVLVGTTYMGADTDDDMGTGTMPNNASINAQVSGDTVTGINSNYPTVPTRHGTLLQWSQTTNGKKVIDTCPPLGYYPGDGKGYIYIEAAELGDVEAQYVLVGKHFTSTSGLYAVGSMPDKRSFAKTLTMTDNSIILPTGYYSNNLIKIDTSQYMNAYTGAVSVGHDSSKFYLRIPKGIYNSATGTGYPEVTAPISSVITSVGVPSASASMSGLTVSFTQPSSGFWSGIRIVGKAGGWPSNADDGQVKWDVRNSTFKCSVPSQAQWYFKIWNYWTDGTNRIYGDSQNLTTYDNRCGCDGQCWCEDDCDSCSHEECGCETNVDFGCGAECSHDYFGPGF